MMWYKKTIIFHVLIAAAVLAMLIFASPPLPIASGAMVNRQAPGDDRPTLEATRMPLTVLPVQTVRAGLTATAISPTPTATAVSLTPTTAHPAPTETITSTATRTATPTTPAPTVAVLAPTATLHTPTPGISPAPTTTPDAVASTQMHYVTHLPTRQVPQQHLPTAGDGCANTLTLYTLLIVALMCCGSGWLLVAMARR